MTPFGIRNKLKSLLGLGGASSSDSSAPKKAEIPTYTVTFVTPDGTTFDAKAKEGDTLVMSSNRGAAPIATGCADGTCGTCRVEVILCHDQLTPETEHERETKQKNAVPKDFRLGCQVGVLGEGIKVKIVNVLGAT